MQSKELSVLYVDDSYDINATWNNAINMFQVFEIK